MARLNEPPVSTDSLETLRKKLLRQNRDLAKSNNVRALRIRELENDCAIMLSENLELRGRILELEKEVEDNDSRRIADHALAIKVKLESQLTEWGTLLAGLGLEPPIKRHSPRIRKTNRQRLSFSSARPSPSQRRLRDMAREIEELGHISETKSYPRMTMNPEQILALRSEADATDSAESPELGPPPISKFIDEDPVKVDSPSRPRSVPTQESPKVKVTPPETLSSPQTCKIVQRLPSPEKKKTSETTKLPETQPEETKQPAPKPEQPPTTEASVPRPAKVGSKRKLATREDMTSNQPQRSNNENEPPRALAGKQLIREKAGGRTLKELSSMRKDARERVHAVASSRKPLSAKSTNDDMTSPKKTSKTPAIDEVAAAKADLEKPKSLPERPKPKPKVQIPVCVDAVLEPVSAAPAITELPCALGTPLQAAALLSPGSADTMTPVDATRGGTPPPAGIDASREASRPSRRNRTAVSYAEPSLRDKMRRPTKELYDAVAGEGRYARRSSVAEQLPPNATQVKCESGAGESWRNLPLLKKGAAEHDPDSIPASPLAGKGSSPAEQEMGQGVKSEEQVPDSSALSEVDLYEFPTASPKADKLDAAVEAKKQTSGRRASRRISSVVHNEENITTKERSSSRRRSMML